MKELVNIESTYLENYDVNVKPYLRYAEVQRIVNEVKKLKSWAERQQCIDMYVLLYATDIGEDKINELGHDKLYECGLIDAVSEEIENYRCIYEAIGYEESLLKTLADLSKEMPKFVEAAEMVKKNADSKK